MFRQPSISVLQPSIDPPRNRADSPQWYVLYLRSRCEKKVLRQLSLRGVECFLPLIEEIRVWSDRKKRVEVPLFPGYIFVRMDLRNRLTALDADGVVCLVGIRNQPSPVPQEQIDWVRLVVGSPATLRKELSVPVGEEVEVVAGLFRGIRGIVRRCGVNSRVVISVSSVGQVISVEVPMEFLRLRSRQAV